MRVKLALAKNRLATGIDRYARELTAALRGQGVDVEERVLERRELAIGPARVGGYASLWAQRLLASRGGCDLLHALDPAVATGRADVVTIQDLLPEEFPELFQTTRRDRLDTRLSRGLARRARWFLVPTEATRQSLVARWGVPEARVVVVPHGIDHDKFRPTPGGSPLAAPGKRTFVYVGDDNPRKNVLLAVRALAALKARHGIDARLVRVGPTRFPPVHEEYRRAASDAGVELVEPGFLDDDALTRLLSACDAFVWPTRGEGFGFPPLEAMACGAPVVALDTPVNREVCGPLACYHPDEADACADALATVLRAPPAAEVLNAHARTFTWENAARKTREVYARALE